MQLCNLMRDDYNDQSPAFQILFGKLCDVGFHAILQCAEQMQLWSDIG